MDICIHNIEAGVGREDEELRHLIFAEAGIDDNSEEIWKKLFDWIEGNSELAQKFIARSVNKWAEQLVKVDEVKLGNRVIDRELKKL